MFYLYVFLVLVVTHVAMFFAGSVYHQVVAEKEQAIKDSLKKAAEKL